MNLNKVLKNNLLFLQQHQQIKNAQIAALAGLKGYDLTKSYVGKILNVSKVANVSLDKVCAFSAVFEHRPVDMLNPLGFKEDGSPQGTEDLLNEDILLDSIVEVETVMQELNITNPQFKARAITVIYAYKKKNDDTKPDLRSVLQELAK